MDEDLVSVDKWLVQAPDRRERVVISLNSTGQVRELQLRLRFRFKLRTLAGKELIPRHRTAAAA